MSNLADEAIILARKGEPTIDQQEWQALLDTLPGWEISRQDGVDKLTREYGFRDYLVLLDLAIKIGRIAEQANHHPVIVIEWGKATVSWWTHTLGGLHRNDFIMAAKCDRAAKLVSAP